PALDRPDAPDSLLQFLLGVAIRLIDRLGRLAEIVEMAELMRDTVKGLGHRLADALLAIGDHAGDRHRRPGAPGRSGPPSPGPWTTRGSWPGGSRRRGSRGRSRGLRGRHQAAGRRWPG